MNEPANLTRQPANLQPAGPEPIGEHEPSYAVGIADSSYGWYRRAAITARRYHRVTEVVQLIGSAAIPVSAAIAHSNTAIPAALGALVVVTTGLRAAFHWHDDYLRFSQAREAVEGERRRFLTASPPYDDQRTRDQFLVAAVSEIEQREMGAWLKISRSNRPPSQG